MPIAFVIATLVISAGCAPTFDARVADMLAPTVRVQAGTAIGSGTAVLASEIGTIVITNHHVAIREGGPPVTVETFRYVAGRTEPGDRHPAIVLAGDRERDIAVLLVVGRRLPSARLGRLDDMPHGGDVWASGAQLGMRPHLTRGTLSLHAEEVPNPSGGTGNYVLSSAPTLSGNSGGGLYRLRNGRYEMIGVPTLGRIIGFGTMPHLSYSVPISDVRAILDRMGIRAMAR